METVVSIIVTYHPDYETLGRLFDAIMPQVAHVVVVDNSDDESYHSEISNMLPVNGHMILQGYNSGIATAFNTGVAEAKALDASHVILFDQDSLPAPDMVACLLNHMNQATENGQRVAAVGPNYVDVKGQKSSPFVKMKGFRLCRVECKENEIVTVDHLISSGSLISMKALDDIGLMEDELFIDYVDTEWCLRAIHKGYQIYGVGSARMKHDLGDEYAHLFGRAIPVHHPLRHYYTVRNGIWLIQQSWVSFSWKVMDFRRLFLIYLVFSFFVGKRLLNMKMLSLGIWHALIGKMGKYGE